MGGGNGVRGYRRVRVGLVWVGDGVGWETGGEGEGGGGATLIHPCQVEAKLHGSCETKT
jgi:hypothetical protein